MKTERLLEIFTRHGIEVIFTPLQYSSGGLLQHGGRWYCLVSSCDSPTRQRWTLAHELGHYFLHARPGLHGLFNDSAREREANRFAADLLMPAETVLAYWEALSNISDYKTKLKCMARQFGVSMQAMEIRLKEVKTDEFVLDSAFSSTLRLSGAGNRAK